MKARTDRELVSTANRYFENGAEAHSMGDVHYARRCSQALVCVTRMLVNRAIDPHVAMIWGEQESLEPSPPEASVDFYPMPLTEDDVPF